MIVGIVVGLLIWVIVDSLTSFFVLQTPETGLFEGFVAGIWAAWPFFHRWRVDRHNFLHPTPRRYKVPLKQAFSKIRQLIGEKTYNFGDKWRVSTADTVRRRISATLPFTDEYEYVEFTSSDIRTRKERERRLLELDVQMKEEPSDITVVQFDFNTKVEGSAWNACDSIVKELVNDAEAALGPGVDAGSAANKSLPAPPWWLIAVGVLGILGLCFDVSKAVFR